MRALRVLCLASLLTCAWANARAQELRGRVIAVSDGDTLTVRVGREKITVRLQGIDAPEKRQPYGALARKHLLGLVYTEKVVVLAEKMDRHGRVVAKVLRDGRDIGLAQMEAGLAWHYAEYEQEQTVADRRLYRAAEMEARKLHRGLWRESNPLPPWDYRRSTRSSFIPRLLLRPSSLLFTSSSCILPPELCRSRC